MNLEHVCEEEQITINQWPMRQPLAIQIGSMTSPTKRCATDSEAKKRLEIVRNDSLL